MRKYTASVCAAATIILCLSARLSFPLETVPDAIAAKRIVILSPAAADILLRLDAGSRVVGVTGSVQEFPAAVKVGTHLNPGIEKIASLKPDLIIASSRFDPELAGRMGANLFLYEPKTLDDIITAVRALSDAVGKKEAGTRLAAGLQAVLDGLKQPPHTPAVLYETRSTPVAVAKKHTVIRDVLERAGMRYAFPESTGAVSLEYLMAHQPEYYIYQEGPMNRNPVPPSERPGWEHFGSCAWKVNEFDFARPNTRLFETVKLLNDLLHTDAPCDRGKAVYGE